MLDFSGFESGAALVAMTGAAIGWGLRPLFLRYRRAFVVAAAALATVGAAAYELFDDDTPVAEAPRIVAKAPVAREVLVPQTAPVAAAASDSPFVAEYLETAGDSALADGDYDTAIRYWRDALAQPSLPAPHQRELTQAIARAQRLADYGR